VANIKKNVDNKEPHTFHMGKNLKHIKTKEIFEEQEHLRRLDAMSKRILNLGKKHERMKNKDDPLSNPVYFFKRPGDEKAVKLLSLDNYMNKLKDLNKEERNKMLLNEVIYNSLNPNGGSKTLSNVNLTSNLNQTSKVIRPISADPDKLIKIHLKMKLIETGKNFKEILKNDMEKKSNKASNLNKIRCQSANSKINQAIKVKSSNSR